MTLDEVVVLDEELVPAGDESGRKLPPPPPLLRLLPLGRFWWLLW